MWASVTHPALPPYPDNHAQVRAAYIEAIRAAHPDVNPLVDTTRAAAAINTAYEALVQVRCAGATSEARRFAGSLWESRSPSCCAPVPVCSKEAVSLAASGWLLQRAASRS